MTARRARDERGAVVILVAFSVVALAIITALVVDIGQLRADRRTNKSITDAAARAGVSRLPFGPWSGVCRARQYLLTNAKGFSSFDLGSETWSNAASPPTVYGTSPCPAHPLTPDVNPCAPGNPASWATLQATAGGGRFSIRIQSGYLLPDPAFSEDSGQADAGDPAAGSCDNLAVVVTERRNHSFANVMGVSSGVTRVRSVGRLNSIETVEFVAALQLLERNNCNVFQVGGSNTRVVVQPFQGFPGTIQIDSAGDAASCPQPILNAQEVGSTSNPLPPVLACSTNSTFQGCTPGLGATPSRIGVYALNLNTPPDRISTPYPRSYGDTKVVASPRVGRRPADVRYRQNVINLESEVRTMLTGNGGKPPGCGSIVDNTCTGNGVTWVVLQQTQCNDLANFFLTPGRTTAQRIWFDCNLDVGTPLTLTAPNSTIVITGKLLVRSTFTITDPRRVYIGGESTGSKVGLEVAGSTSVLNVNRGAAPTCSARVGAGVANRLVVGNGSLKVGAGGTMRLCQTFFDLASGYGKVPATDGTVPCQTTACVNYTGTMSVSSGGLVDWSAPNEISGRSPSAEELATTNLFEDLALWTEAGGNTSSMAGGAGMSLTGAFFMPNANAFNLAGGGDLPIYLSAQFIATSMKVTGGATVNLVPDPHNSITTYVYNILLVR